VLQVDFSHLPISIVTAVWLVASLRHIKPKEQLPVFNLEVNSLSIP
jgi:hypothetical protein